MNRAEAGFDRRAHHPERTNGSCAGSLFAPTLAYDIDDRPVTIFHDGDNPRLRVDPRARRGLRLSRCEIAQSRDLDEGHPGRGEAFTQVGTPRIDRDASLRDDDVDRLAGGRHAFDGIDDLGRAARGEPGRHEGELGARGRVGMPPRSRR